MKRFSFISPSVKGPDGKPCKVCMGSDWKSWSRISRGSPNKSASSHSSGVSVGLGAAAIATSPPDASPSATNQCPVDIDQLGRATWTFLHTAAAYYPTHPTSVQRSSMLALLKSLPFTYPCHHCASHLAENMKENPPELHVTDRATLSRWLCERHNDVNVRLGKARFDCKETDERWRDGPADGSCD
jgi:mitochondrial FAD-linked sulfhydryl oxidase